MKKILLLISIILTLGLSSCALLNKLTGGKTESAKAPTSSDVTPSESSTTKEVPTSDSPKTASSSGENPTTTVVPSTSGHEHTYNSTWSYDNNNHWHEATCGHDVKKDLAKHDFESTISNDKITYTCKVCGATFESDSAIKLEKLYGYNYFKDNITKYVPLYEDMFTASNEFLASNTDVDTKVEVGSKDVYYISKINYSDYSLSKEEATAIWETFYIENPQFYFLDSQFIYDEYSIYLTISNDYLNHTKRDVIKTELDTLFTDVQTKLVNASTTLEKIYLLHDYILSNTEYAYKSDGITPEDEAWAHNIIGFVEKHKGVCESYAKTFIYLSRLFDINTIGLTGSSRDQKHMWNAAKVDDTWYEFDFTWDDNAKVDYGFNYFALSREEMSKDHDINDQTLGIDYLYPIPTFALKPMNIVKLYSGETYLGLYKSINEALANVSEDSDYEIQLVNYFGRNASIDKREYELSNIEKNYKSLKLLGFKDIATVSTDGVSCYPPQTLKLKNDVTITNNTTIENTILESDTYTLKIKDSTLTLKEFVSVKAPITNDNGTIICDSSINKIEFKNSLSITNLINQLGQNIIASNSEITNLTLSAALSGEKPKAPRITFVDDNTTITIGNIIYENSTSNKLQSTLLVSSVAENAKLNIGNITKGETSTNNYFIFNINTNDLKYYPNVKFENNISVDIYYLVLSTTLEKANFVGQKILKTTETNKAKLHITFYKNDTPSDVSLSNLTFDDDGYLVLNA